MTHYRARRPVELNAEQLPAIEGLEQAIPKLSQRDRDFAGDLLSNFRRWGRLSEKQMQWVDTLTQRAAAPAPAPAQQVNVQKIQELFTTAAQRLRRIKVALQAASGQRVVFTRAGAMSKYAGQIMITDGAPFGQNKFFGRIDENGDFYATRSADADIRNLVTEFANNPAETAGKYGRLTGGCSFCSHKLDDNRSLEVGYGPVCAKRFGLVWG